MRRSILAGVAQQELSIRGFRARAPLFYRDLHMMGAVLFADLDAARRLLPAGYVPLSIFGRALCGVHCFEYRDTDIGPYNEVALTIALRRTLPRLPSLAGALVAAVSERFHVHVVQLPVTTDVALWGGVDFFGFPKYLADIRFDETDAERICRVLDRDTGDPLIEVAGRKLAPSAIWSRAGVLTTKSYPQLAGQPLVATVRINPFERATRLLGGGLRVCLGSSPLVAELAALRLGPVLEYFWVPRADAILDRPEAATVDRM